MDDNFLTLLKFKVSRVICGLVVSNRMRLATITQDKLRDTYYIVAGIRREA